jgi:hypothetical protein
VAKLNISAPAFLISFWRCGSNFVANVVSESSGLDYETIYHPDLPLLDRNLERLILLKSHAPSYAHLLAELGAYCPRFPGLPHRFIVLWRDPRDMMISFYDWLCARLGEHIPQNRFLHDPRYGYAVAGMGQMNLCDAFRRFVKNWYVNHNLHNLRSYRFEDILADKYTCFASILDFLDLKTLIKDEALVRRVKQGPSKRTTRGISGAWRSAGGDYLELVQLVSRHLGQEIELLGYANSIKDHKSVDGGE